MKSFRDTTVEGKRIPATPALNITNWLFTEVISAAPERVLALSKQSDPSRKSGSLAHAIINADMGANNPEFHDALRECCRTEERARNVPIRLVVHAAENEEKHCRTNGISAFSGLSSMRCFFQCCHILVDHIHSTRKQ
jgi:hypothetical protein